MKAEVVFQLENSAWPAFLVAANGKIEDVNAAAQAFFGDLLEPREFSALGEGETASSTFLQLCDNMTGPLLPLRFRNREGASVSFQTSISALTLGAQKYFLFQLFPVASGSTTLIVRKPEDRTATVEITAAQKQKLDCAMQLTRTVALDFNNALTTILGHATYVLGQMETSNPSRFSLTEIERASKKASDIANDLAAFSLDERDKKALVEGNLNMLIRRASQIVQAGERRNVVWAQEFEKQLYTAHFDESKLHQAFVKILENALEAIGDSATGQITIETRNVDVAKPMEDGHVRLVSGTYVCVEVTDDGCGIDPTVLPRIFEPFFSTKHDRRGLGLAWVYGVISNHGGSVAVTSQQGQGTSVRVYLPAVKKFIEETHFVEKDLSGEGTILFVDDESMLVALGQMLLSSAGYKVLTATSAERALEVMERASEPIHLLITDMVMPRMNGHELIQRVRETYPSTRIICSTACLRAAHSVQNYQFLPKPFSAQDLLRLVKSTLVSVN
jgi:two-component system, cell cycle sensor histidine kinase and response regulator CckA